MGRSGSGVGRRAACAGRNSGHLLPYAEGTVPCSPVFIWDQEVVAELEMIVGAGVGGQEALDVVGRLEPLHLPLPSARRLVRDLDLVVQVFALPVLDMGQDLIPSRSDQNPEQVWAYLRANFPRHRVWNSYGTIVDACCDAWRKLMNMPQRLASITRRTWAGAVSG